MAALADRWGVNSHRAGKVVWFVLRSKTPLEGDKAELALQS